MSATRTTRKLERDGTAAPRVPRVAVVIVRARGAYRSSVFTRRKARRGAGIGVGGSRNVANSVAPRDTSGRGAVRTLLIASERPPHTSGVAEAIRGLSNGLRARGHAVDVLAGVDARYLKVGEFRFNSLVSRWPTVARSISTYDVVNVHGPAPTISDTYLALLRTVPRSRRPRVVYTHYFCLDLPGWKHASRAYDRVHSRLAHLADSIIVTSGSYRSMIEARRGPPVDLIPWGVDLDRFSGSSRQTPYEDSRPLRVLFVGQMRKYKGIADLVHAGSPENPDWSSRSLEGAVSRSSIAN